VNPIKRVLLDALAARGVRPVLRPFRRGTGTIFMLHRLSDPETGAVGMDPANLRVVLAFLRRRGYELVDLREMFRRLKEPGGTTDLGVAFSIDDGYAEQARIAGPIFAEFDCPATVFVTTGFLDQQLWLWWDRIEYVFDTCRRRNVMTTIGETTLKYRWDVGEGPAEATANFTARCKQVPDEVRHDAIARLAESAEVDLPALAPRRYAPMSWPELRRWEERGLAFGPHTVSHPVLSRTNDEQSRREIAGSWSRLCAMACRPTPVFCYPNGQREDFGPREWSTLQSLGFEGALAATPGYAETAEFRARPENAFAVRRFLLPDDYRMAAKYVSGAERIRYGTGRLA